MVPARRNCRVRTSRPREALLRAPQAGRVGRHPMPACEVALDGSTVPPVALQVDGLHAVVGIVGCAVQLQANQQRLHLAAQEHVQRP